MDYRKNARIPSPRQFTGTSMREQHDSSWMSLAPELIYRFKQSRSAVEGLRGGNSVSG